PPLRLLLREGKVSMVSSPAFSLSECSAPCDVCCLFCDMVVLSFSPATIPPGLECLHMVLRLDRPLIWSGGGSGAEVLEREVAISLLVVVETLQEPLWFRVPFSCPEPETFWRDDALSRL